MKDKLSIRTYTPKLNTHHHDYNQLVLPLHGVIDMSINEQDYSLGIGQCAIVKVGVSHSFKAMKHARFLVADLGELPANIINIDSPFVATSNSLQTFCRFAEAQLEDHLNAEIEDSIVIMFKKLLENQSFNPRVDKRIACVIELLSDDLSVTLSLQELASKANLSVSQLKTLFKESTGKTCGQYLLKLRMEKARALLANTDTPSVIVAETVGYRDQSAFSRRFTAYFGQSPRTYRSL